MFSPMLRAEPGSWGMQAGHKSSQQLFLILNEVWPIQGRDGEGFPTFPGGSPLQGATVG